MPVTINGTTGVTTPGATVGAITGILKATSGVVSQAVAGTDYLTSTSGGAITLSTAQTASGTSVDFTGIPSWVKRITVMFSQVSTNGTSPVQIQLGDSGGIEITGYSSVAFSYNSGTAASSTTGYVVDQGYTGAAQSRNGSYVLNLLSGSTWAGSGVLSVGSCTPSAGGKSLSGTLDSIRITTVGGTDTFDAGTINISYE